jgi:CDP-glucose 4,6-dehydratase
MVSAWGEGASFSCDEGPHPHEARYLKLDISKARQELGWLPRWTLQEALARIVAWHRAWMCGEDMREACLRDIAAYDGSAWQAAAEASDRRAAE